MSSEAVAFWDGEDFPIKSEGSVSSVNHKTNLSDDEKIKVVSDLTTKMTQSGDICIVVCSSLMSEKKDKTLSSLISNTKGKGVLITNSLSRGVSAPSRLPSSLPQNYAEIQLSAVDKETFIDQYLALDSVISQFLASRETSIGLLSAKIAEALEKGRGGRSMASMICCLPPSDGFLLNQRTVAKKSTPEPVIFNTFACLEGSGFGDKLSVDFRKNIRHFAPGDRVICLEQFEAQQLAAHATSEQDPLLVTMAMSAGFVSAGEGRLCLQNGEAGERSIPFHLQTEKSSTTDTQRASPPLAMIIGIEEEEKTSGGTHPAPTSIVTEEGVFTALWRESSSPGKDFALVNGWLQIIQQLGRGVPLPYALGALGIPCAMPLASSDLYFNSSGVKFSGKRLGKFMDQNWGCVVKPEFLQSGDQHQQLEKAVRQGLGKALDLDDWVEISKISKEGLHHFVRVNWIDAFCQRLKRFGGERMTLRKFIWLLREGGNKPDLDNISPDVSCQQQ